jgi:hypothetical protein
MMASSPPAIPAGCTCGPYTLVNGDWSQVVYWDQACPLNGIDHEEKS